MLITIFFREKFSWEHRYYTYFLNAQIPGIIENFIISGIEICFYILNFNVQYRTDLNNFMKISACLFLSLVKDTEKDTVALI